MEEKKNTMEQLDIEELSDVNGGYENAVRSVSYSATRASSGVRVGTVSEADAIRQSLRVPDAVAVNMPQHASSNDEASSSLKWKESDL